MDDREHAADHQREDRDGLGRARHRLAPAGVGQAQDRRNQRAGVRDADPEHKVDDVEAPKDRPPDARHADARDELVTPGEARPGDDQANKCRPPSGSEDWRRAADAAGLRG